MKKSKEERQIEKERKKYREECEKYEMTHIPFTCEMICTDGTVKTMKGNWFTIFRKLWVIHPHKIIISRG